jgi:hypothetical protein
MLVEKIVLVELGESQPWLKVLAVRAPRVHPCNEPSNLKSKNKNYHVHQKLEF